MLTRRSSVEERKVSGGELPWLQVTKQISIPSGWSQGGYPRWIDSIEEGYWKVRIAEGDEPKTTSVTRYGMTRSTRVLSHPTTVTGKD
ncbi:hypothetical protein VNO77_46268 [Canavalia gladiata]|uniref:Uncharacterized protein n=1 Tax=Canavalia gladiata TaxID=3824 RepID=A0AAN9JBV1_CANGL